MKTYHLFFALSLSSSLLLLNACAKKETPDKYYETTQTAPQELDEAITSSKIADSTSNSFFSSSAAQVKDKTTDQFIRTAEMKFKVKNVRLATTHIEDITARFSGYVTYTHLVSETHYAAPVPISEDSTLLVTPFVVSNKMVVRVPNDKLDSALRTVAKLIEFLDYRTITATDMAIPLLAQKMTQQRVKKHTNRLSSAIDQRGKKLDETTYAEDNLLERQQQADNATLTSQQILSDIAYSTMTLHLYQTEESYKELIANPKNITAYELSFWKKLGSAFAQSWNLLEEFILIVAQVWWVLISMVGLVILYRYLKKTK